MHFKLWVFVFGILTVTGCANYPVSGKLDITDPDIHREVYLIDPVSFSSLASSFEGKVIDSARVNEDGSFGFKSMPARNGEYLYLLAIQKRGETYATKLQNDDPEVSNYLPFIYVTGHKVRITGNVSKGLGNASITGSVESNRHITSLIRSRIRLFDQFRSDHTGHDEENLLEYEKAKYDYQAGLMKAADSSGHFLTEMLALRWISPEGDYERIPEFVIGSCKKWKMGPFAGHKWTAQLCARSMTMPRVPGDAFPDASLPLISGDTVSLMQLKGQKLTLVDLWASWCAPCRRENTSILVPLWDKYHDKGFQIIGYALDSSRKGLENAITRDGVGRWPQGSHLMGDESPLFDTLRISTIPANYLLDSNGTIVAKNLHGTQLIQFIDRYMAANN